MSTNIVLKKSVLLEENEELVIKEIATEIINDLILEFCFEMHRAIKLGYIESYFVSQNKMHPQESKSSEGSFLECKLFGFNKSQEYQFSNQQGTIYSKNMDGLGGISSETAISLKDVNSSPINSKEDKNSLEYHEQCEKTKKNKMEVSATKPSLSETLNNNNECNLNCFTNTAPIPHWYFQENTFFPKVMNGEKNGSVPNSDVLEFSDEHSKLSTEGVQEVSTLVNHNDVAKSSEFLGYYKSLQMENEWIKEAFHCSGCKNSKSLQDWMSFIIALTQAEENKTMMERNVKESLVDKKIQYSILSNKAEQISEDIFGNDEKSVKKSIYKKTCTCTICKRKIGAVRFAYHLGSCIGLGRRRSTRMDPITKQNK